MRYKRFPPFGGNLLLSTSSRRAALSALALYPACRARAVWGQRVARAAVELFGTGVLPGREVTWEPERECPLWPELVEQWSRRFGRLRATGVFESVGAGFSALLSRQDEPVGFVKLGGAGRSIGNEREAIRAMGGHDPRSFAVPEVLDAGSIDGWHWILTGSLPAEPTREPADPPLGTILEEVQAGLSALSRPPDAPAHWRPMHGDFTPWNLRRLADGVLLLFDWERAGWGPPDADRVFYLATRAAVHGDAPPDGAARETTGYWREAILKRDRVRDSWLARGILAALDRMEAKR
ncbi:MAG: phosphotransferase [Gemmatimonadota bacterium]|nr:phosphotransferase [Gemmatimonadota bacterium]